MKALKQRLHEQQGLPPRFRQRLFHEGNNLDDVVRLETAMDLQVVILALSEISELQQELRGAAINGNVAQAGCALLTSSN